MKSKRRKPPIQTGLEIQTKPIPRDKGITQREHEERVMQIHQEREAQETLDKLAEAHVAKRKPLPRINQSVPRQVAPRPQVHRVAPVRGLLHPEPQPQPSPLMGGLLGSFANTSTKRK